ncbi:hypothetical protein IQ07DRAFT_583211 [Pyrenochaeta sp. DS3sAY3a]|nr:hypothetical protein IQ07DRAFT_583211 [Pyrenochaeta sp. DS3sAY3a]
MTFSHTTLTIWLIYAPTCMRILAAANVASPYPNVAKFLNLLPVGISGSSRRGYDGFTRIYRLVLELDEALTWWIECFPILLVSDK